MENENNNRIYWLCFYSFLIGILCTLLVRSIRVDQVFTRDEIVTEICQQKSYDFCEVKQYTMKDNK